MSAFGPLDVRVPTTHDTRQTVRTPQIDDVRLIIELADGCNSPARRNRREESGNDVLATTTASTCSKIVYDISRTRLPAIVLAR